MPELSLFIPWLKQPQKQQKTMVMDQSSLGFKSRGKVDAWEQVAAIML